MTADSQLEHLASVRYVVVAVRLAIAKDARLVYGEIVDGQGPCGGRLRTWADVATALQGCATAAAAEDPSAPPSL